MGFEDRHYNREESYGSSRGLSQYSIIAILIGINVIIWLLDSFTPVVGGDRAHWLTDSLLSLKTSQPWKIWTYLTYGFAHASIDSQTGIWHIGGNMLVLFFLGRPIAYLLGRYEFMRFYLVAIVVSGLAWLIWMLSTNSPGSVVGASGAVSAIVAYFIFRFPHEKLLVWGVLPVRAWILGAFIIGQELFRAVGGGSGIAWQAHLAGLAFGAAYYKLNWNFSSLGEMFSKFTDRSPSLKVHDPDPSVDVRAEKLKSQADDILAKISEQGEESLTRKERKILEKYSKSLRGGS